MLISAQVAAPAAAATAATTANVATAATTAVEPSLSQLLDDVAEMPRVIDLEEERRRKRRASDIADDWLAKKLRAIEHAFDAEQAAATLKPNTETLEDYVDAEVIF